MIESVLPLSVVALISGRGSNLQAIIDASTSGQIPVKISAVISNNPEAPGLERARSSGINAKAIDHKKFSSRDAFDHELSSLIDSYNPDLVILAGFMRILGTEFVDHYAGRMMNIHPSLLPDFRGLHTHERAIETKRKTHGASVHFVTSELDGGPLILQSSIPILADDNPDILAARVLEQEHIIYPLAVKWFAQGRLRMQDNGIVFDDAYYADPIQLASAPA